MQVRILSGDASPGVDADDRPVKPPPLGPVAPGIDGITGHVPGHGLQGIGAPVDRQVRPRLALSGGSPHPSSLLNAHGGGPVTDGGVRVGYAPQELCHMDSHLHCLSRGLAAHEKQGTLRVCQDPRCHLNGLIPARPSQISIHSYKRLLNSVRAYDLLELGIAHLAGIPDRKTLTLQLHLNIITGGPADWTDNIFCYHHLTPLLQLV